MYLIPIIGIIMGCSVPMVILYLDYKKKRSIYELHHRERLAAIDKGMEPPPLPSGLFGDEAKTKGPPNHLLSGLIWLGVGGGMWIAGGVIEDEFRALGFIPLLVGVAYLLYYAIEGRKVRAAFLKSVTSEKSGV